MIRNPIHALILALLVALMACAPSDDPVPQSGIWRIEMAHPGGPLPFNLEISADGKQAWLLNQPERLEVEELRWDGNQLALAFPSYGSRITLLFADDGVTGTAHLVRRDGPVTLAINGKRGAFRFVDAPSPSFDPGGDWTFETGGEQPQKGRGQFRNLGGKVSGSVQFPTGDTRYLAGEADGDRIRLSTFDGNSTSLWLGQMAGDSLVGERWSATSTMPTRWTARRADAAASASDYVTVEVPDQPIQLAFAFPDVSGRTVSLANPEFAGKVVVIAIGGAWCPNCHDEARFLSERARELGSDVAIIGLQFEYGDDPKAAFAQLERFARRYQLPYPLLLAGQPTPESTQAALPQLNGVRVYPTTLFIDRKGFLRETHIGWSGPATGVLHEQAKAKFDATVARLLAEPA